MKIILRVYKEIRLGNFSTMIIDIPSNRITVKELKSKIYKKYKIKPNEQRLTFRLGHKKLITLNDIFPLSYFYIKENSMIFLEVIKDEPKPKPEEIKKLEKRNSIKYKYMNMLGYFPPDAKTFEKMGINEKFKKRKLSSFYESENSKNSIKYNDNESEKNSLIFINGEDFNDSSYNVFELKKEYNSENKINYRRSTDFSKINNNSSNIEFNDSTDFNTFSTKHVRKVSINCGHSPKRTSQAKTNYKTSSSFNSGNSSSIVNNNLNICEILNKNGWNALHYICFFGNDEILNYILNKYSIKLGINLNFNLNNNEGWTPLLLAVYKQHIKCVEILLGIDNLDVNYLSDVGTALHLACKKNNRQMVSKLIYKANPFIKDKNKKIALEYTNDKTIIKLISKLIFKKFETTDKNSKLYEEYDNFIKDYNHILIYKKSKDINKLNNSSSSNNNNIYNIISLKGEKILKMPPYFFGEFEQLGGFFSFNKKKYLNLTSNRIDFF